MFNAAFPLPFTHRDLELLSVEAVSGQLRVSRAFVRLCIRVGCPTRKGKLSAAELLTWLFTHYAQVRKVAGLAKLLEVEGIAENAAQRVRMANALFTLLDFGASRASNLKEKRELWIVRGMVERALDRN
jgi:hypothetical protein